MKLLEHFGRQIVRARALVAYDREFLHLNVVRRIDNDFGLMTDADKISDVKSLRELVNSLRF